MSLHNPFYTQYAQMKLSQNIHFRNLQGQQLAAKLDLPAAPPHHYALFAHCFTCSKNIRAAYHISNTLTQAGFGVLRFDFTGLGDSEGQFADTNFSSNIDDLVAAAHYLTNQHGSPCLLIGHSLGGTAVLWAAERIESVRALVTIGSPAEPGHLVHHFEPYLNTIETEGQVDVMLEGRPFTFKRQFVEDLGRYKGFPATQEQTGCALMVCHAPQDTVVSIEHAARIFKQARHPKSFLSLDTADHLLSQPADAQYVGQLIGLWAKRYAGEQKR